MAEYVNFQSILNAALGQYQSQGFRLVESGGHAFLNLYYQDERIRVLSQDDATAQTVRRACQEHLESLSAI